MGHLGGNARLEKMTSRDTHDIIAYETELGTKEPTYSPPRELYEAYLRHINAAIIHSSEQVKYFEELFEETDQNA